MEPPNPGGHCRSAVRTGGPLNCDEDWLTCDHEDPVNPDTVAKSPLYPEYSCLGGKIEKWEPRIQVAPMLAVTDRHFRYFCRLLTRRTQLWTEMVVDNTLINVPHLEHHLAFSPVERPLV